MDHKPILRCLIAAVLLGWGVEGFAAQSQQPPKRSAPLIQINVNTPPTPNPIRLTSQLIEQISRQMQHRLILDEAQFLKLLRLNEKYLLNIEISGPRRPDGNRPPHGEMRPGGRPPGGPAGPRPGKPGAGHGPKEKGPMHDNGRRAYGNPFAEIPTKDRKQWEKQLKNILSKDQYKEWRKMEKENNGKPFRY